MTVLSLSVAFAATLSSRLEINGNANIGNAKWDVHFKTATTAANSGLIAISGPTISGAGNNTVSYEVTLEENKSYVMEIIVENSGTYDAKLSELILTGAEDYDFITYTVTGMTVNSDTDILPANGGTKTLTLTVSMGEITNDNVEKLENGLALTLTATANFVQA